MDAHAPDYEPLQSATIGARAAAAGVRPWEILMASSPAVSMMSSPSPVLNHRPPSSLVLSSPPSLPRARVITPS